MTLQGLRNNTKCWSILISFIIEAYLILFIKEIYQPSFDFVDFLQVLHDLKAMEEIFAPASKVDLGGDAQIVSKLQESFNIAKPEFQV